MFNQMAPEPDADRRPPRSRVPAFERRYPPGCPDPDWCAGNGVCYWCCDRSPDDEGLWEDEP